MTAFQRLSIGLTFTGSGLRFVIIETSGLKHTLLEANQHLWESSVPVATPYPPEELLYFLQEQSDQLIWKNARIGINVERPWWLAQTIRCDRALLETYPDWLDWEIKQQLIEPENNLIIDRWRIATEPDSNVATVKTLVCPTSLFEPVRELFNTANLQLTEFVPGPLALLASYQIQNRLESTEVLLLDLAEKVTNLVLVHNPHSEQIAAGSGGFVSPRETIEDLSLIGSLEALESHPEELVSLVSSFKTASTDELHLIISGAGAKNQNIQKHLRQIPNATLTIATPFDSLFWSNSLEPRKKELHDNSHLYAIPLGVALSC